jgi:hypothetical protein
LMTTEVAITVGASDDWFWSRFDRPGRLSL